MLNFHVRNIGGLNGIITQPALKEGSRYYFFIFFEHSFFFLVSKFVLQVCLAICIFGFTQFREEKERRHLKVTKQCLICGLDMSKFDQKG